VDWLYSKVIRRGDHAEWTNDYCTFVKILQLNASGPLQHSINFVVNDDDTPPEYNVTPKGIPFPVEAHISQTFLYIYRSKPIALNYLVALDPLQQINNVSPLLV
jgi:hypothetical protein